MKTKTPLLLLNLKIMKASIISRLLLVLFIITFIGCSKSSSDDDSSNQDTKIRVLRAKIAGFNKEFYVWSPHSFSEETVHITGCEIGAGNWEIRFTFTNSVGTPVPTGLIEYGAVEYGAACCIFDCGNIIRYIITEGSVTLTESTETKIKGTFFITAVNGDNFTIVVEGVFDIEY